MKFSHFLLCLSLGSFAVYAEDPEEEKKQLIEEAKQVKECKLTLQATGLADIPDNQLERFCRIKIWERNNNPGRFAKRIAAEKMTELNPFVITPHKHSYILPVTYSDNFNREPYNFIGDNGQFSEYMESVEAKYQVSFKVPLTQSDVFIEGDAFYFGMTIQAWWQLYSDEISKPFRETNYQPEVFYIAPLKYKPFGFNTGFELGLEHQSNGQAQFLSRSWNRAYLTLIAEKDDLALGFRPWYRFEENEKTDPLQPKGDDNPDIQDYLGHYEIYAAYAFSDEQKTWVMMRKNWQTGNGAIEINYTTPLWGRLTGIIQYFSGYGESLIDYNHKQQKVGIGVALTEVF